MPGKYDDLIKRLRSGARVYKEEIEQAREELSDKGGHSLYLYLYILELYNRAYKEGAPVDYYEDLVLRLKAGMPVGAKEVPKVADELRSFLDGIQPGHEVTSEEDRRAHV